jgi:hypothetical protein
MLRYRHARVRAATLRSRSSCPYRDVPAARSRPRRVLTRGVGAIAVLDRLFDGEAIEGRERSARSAGRVARARER